MELNIKDMFQLKKTDINTSSSLEAQPQNDFKGTTDEYQELGFKRAGRAAGSIEALPPSIHIVIQTERERQARDINYQNESNKKRKIEIEQINAEINSLNVEKDSLNSELDREERKIEDYKEKISDAKNHPEKITADPSNKLNYIIGATILVCITIYLWIFYTSASYSAFFKDFTPDDTKISQAIFDPQAISLALKEGVSELVFIIMIPFVFLGLGYLIHSFQKAKPKQWILKVAGLFVVAFVFDSLLAYQITAEIYNIKQGSSFYEMPDYSLSLAMKNLNFWIIIFAGFVSYIIWGIVFDFVMEAYEKLDKVHTYIKSLEEKISHSKDQCNELKEKIQQKELSLTQKNGAKRKLELEIESKWYSKPIVRQKVMAFLAGWIKYLAAGGVDISEQNKHRNIVESMMVKYMDEEEQKQN